MLHLNDFVKSFQGACIGTETEKKVSTFIFDSSIEFQPEDGSDNLELHDLHHFSALTFNENEKASIFTKISSVLHPEKHGWKPIYKSLRVLEHLVVHGSEGCVDEAWKLIPQVKRLCSYKSEIHESMSSLTGKGTDNGEPVRRVANQLDQLLGNEEKIRKARGKAHKASGSMIASAACSIEIDCTNAQKNKAGFSVEDQRISPHSKNKKSFGGTSGTEVGAKFGLDDIPNHYKGRPERYSDAGADFYASRPKPYSDCNKRADLNLRPEPYSDSNTQIHTRPEPHSDSTSRRTPPKDTLDLLDLNWDSTNTNKSQDSYQKEQTLSTKNGLHSYSSQLGEKSKQQELEAELLAQKKELEELRRMISQQQMHQAPQKPPTVPSKQPYAFPDPSQQYQQEQQASMLVPVPLPPSQTHQINQIRFQQQQQSISAVQPISDRQCISQAGLPSVPAGSLPPYPNQVSTQQAPGSACPTLNVVSSHVTSSGVLGINCDPQHLMKQQQHNLSTHPTGGNIGAQIISQQQHQQASPPLVMQASHCPMPRQQIQEHIFQQSQPQHQQGPSWPVMQASYRPERHQQGQERFFQQSVALSGSGPLNSNHLNSIEPSILHKDVNILTSGQF